MAQSIEENIKKGSSIGLALESAQKTGITYRFIPLRITNNKLAIALTGKTLQQIAYRKPRLSLFGTKETSSLYLGRGDNERFPVKMHPDFQKLQEEGIGVCSQIGETEHCDNCNLYQDVRIAFPLSELVKVKSSEEKRRGKTEKQRRKEELEKQGIRQTTFLDHLKQEPNNT